MNVVPIYLNAMDSGKARPAVLVMPNTDGGQQYGLQCLNDPGGVQDMTYVAEEVPDWAVANLRVMPVGPAWGVAGYSEGGYRAANIAFQYPNRSGFAGSLSGYFSPVESQVPLGGKARAVRFEVNDLPTEAAAADQLARPVHHQGPGHGQRPAVLPRGGRRRPA